MIAAQEDKIMGIKDFNLIIGFFGRKGLNESDSNSNYVPKSLPSWYWKLIEPFSASVTNIAKYADYGSLDRIKEDAEKFRAIIDTMIDIIEKIEAYTLPV